jgi:metal-responsive CopG/Arc/MetJ family transcriptional regulator
MRTLVDIPDKQVEILAEISKSMNLSRAELIRRAIDDYVYKHKPQPIEAFGLWKNNDVDGLTYQEQARAEW